MGMISSTQTVGSSTSKALGHFNKNLQETEQRKEMDEDLQTKRFV